MNKQKLRRKPGEEMRKPKGWHKKLQGGCREKKKKKEELPKNQRKRKKKKRRNLDEEL